MILNKVVIEIKDFEGIIPRFKKIVSKFPHKTALIKGNVKISYKELDEKSDKEASFLYKNYQVSQNVIVILDKGIDLIVTLIAIMKSGGVFVPIDPNLSTNRISEIIEQVDGNLIVCDEKYKERITKILEKFQDNKSVLSVDDLYLEDNHNLEYVYNKNCYLYFTSGSTGKPKGVLGRERSLEHYITWEIEEFGINENFIVSQLTFPAFDPFLRDVFVPILSGASLAIPEDSNIIMEPRALVQWITKSRINLIHIVPSIFKLLVQAIKTDDCLNDLKYVLMAGELLRSNDLRKFYSIFKDRVNLVNLYGPTETTLAKVFYPISMEDLNRKIIPVGKPISFTEVLILDENMKKCPVGKIGEIYIRTPFISSGYYKQPDLTRKSFIVNPLRNNKKDIIYKTGDLGRIIDNGNIELIGRKDFQVKINGVRIEIGDIENSLLKNDAVDDAVVVEKKNDEGTGYLSAYVVVNKDIEGSELKKYISNEISKYAMPRYFTKLEVMPRLANGKIDRKALLEMKDTIEETDSAGESLNHIERELMNIWNQVLKNKSIGVNSSFFDVGGTSLLLINMHLKLDEKYPGLIKVTDIFANSTIRKLAEFISEKLKSMEKIVIKPIAIDEDFINLKQFTKVEEIQEVKFNEKIKNIINKISIDNHVEQKDILISMYLYLFSELYNEEVVQIQVEDNGKLGILNANFGELSDLNDLFTTVNKSENKYNLALIKNKLKNIKTKKDIIPLIIYNESDESIDDFINYYDVILKVININDAFSLKLFYDSGKLRKKGAETILQCYVQLITSLTEQYE